MAGDTRVAEPGRFEMRLSKCNRDLVPPLALAAHVAPHGRA
jgi:hypothetical protein